MLRYQKSARLEDLDESIEIFGRGLSSDNYSDPNRNKFLRGYAGALQTRFELQDKLGDLELSIKYYRESLALSPTESASRDGWHTSDPGRAQSLYGLGAALRLRFEHSSSTVDLDDAIIFQREAVALEPNNAAFIGDLGASLFGRYQSTGQMEDFDQAVDCQRQALTLEPSQRFYWLNNLAGMHLKRYGMTGQIEDRDLVAHGQSEPSFGQTNQQDNLDKAIACFRECVDIAPSDRYRMVALVNLASAIHTRFERCGVLDDLEEATACHREAAQVGRLALGLNSTVLLGNFAAILTTRYKLFGRMADLEESIKITREALTLTPPNHIDHAMYLNNLGQYLISRYQQKKQLDDLEEAIRSLRSSLSLRTIGHDDYHTTLNLLASALYLRFTLLKQLADLEESITVYRETMTLGRTQSPNHWAAMYNLATALKSRYKTLHQVEDQEEVLELCQRAVAVFRPSHPRLSAALQSLALICIDQGKLEQAFSLFKEAVNLPNSPLNDRLGCAREWAHTARNAGHSSALDAYVKSLELLDLCLASTPTMDLQHQLLAAADTSDDVPDISYLASNSASYAIQAGKLQMAVEMLEQGRALLWSRMRGYRHPLEKLRQVNPRLANDFEETGRLLAKLAVASDMDTTGDRGVQFDDQITRNRELSGRFEKIISDIRETEGFATFLKATPFDSLQRAAENGPVVLVNVDRYRSDALILSSLGPPLLVPLPNNLPDAIDKLSSKLFKMDLTARNTDRYDATHQLSTGDMGTILRLLWVSICKPVSSVLQTMEIPVGSRVWWCPIGKLGTLPLHASGRYEDGVLLEGFSDLYISSYIPTLSSLIASRESATKPIAQLRLLGVGQSNALSSVEGEFKTIREVFPGGIQLRDRADAIPETIIADLQEHPWVHFACHGSLNATSPFESGFVLHNNSRLSLRQIMQAKLSNAELAFLAACHSAAAESKAPNEVLSLAAAMQFCGFKSIVGTLWTMDDKDGPVLAEAFYKHMLRNGVGKVNLLDSAQAVHLATKAMRGAGVPFHRWTTFIHLGV